MWAHAEQPLPVDPTSPITTADIVEVLSAGPTGRATDPSFDEVRPAAVLVLLADGPEGAEVLLTRRSNRLRSHSGEMSFPGGRIDAGETPIAAALREANEEVGLDQGTVEVIGELDHLATVVSHSHVVPIVGRLHRRTELVPTSMEVERVMWVPLVDLLRADTYRVERWHAPPTDRLLHFFELDDETVWGLTAVVLTDLLRRLAIH